MNKIDNKTIFPCPKCNGVKKVEISRVTKDGYDKKEVLCDKCWGSGTLDWIENIVGKEEPDQLTLVKDCLEYAVHNFLFEINDEKTRNLLKQSISDKLDTIPFVEEYIIGDDSPIDNTIEVKIKFSPIEIINFTMKIC